MKEEEIDGDGGDKWKKVSPKEIDNKQVVVVEEGFIRE